MTAILGLRGKRSGMYGAFLLAVYNQETEEFQTISKIGTGFSEEQLKQFSEQLKELTVPAPKPYYRCLAIKFAPACTLLQGTAKSFQFHHKYLPAACTMAFTAAEAILRLPQCWVAAVRRLVPAMNSTDKVFADLQVLRDTDPGRLV